MIESGTRRRKRKKSRRRFKPQFSYHLATRESRPSQTLGAKGGCLDCT
jgi:hypothetical protein